MYFQDQGSARVMKSNFSTRALGWFLVVPILQEFMWECVLCIGGIGRNSRDRDKDLYYCIDINGLSSFLVVRECMK